MRYHPTTTTNTHHPRTAAAAIDRVCERIAGNMLREVSDLLKKRGITTTFSPGVRVQLAKLGFSEEFGARELKRLLKRRIEDPITELILDKDLGAGSTITVRVKNGEFAFSASTAETKTASLQPA